MISPPKALQQTLRQHGYSLTTARTVVFLNLQEQEPQTMHQLIAACSPIIDRASVYRAITVYEKLGIVQRLPIGWKYKLELSDSFHTHHHHLTCTGCGSSSPLDEDGELENRLAMLARDKRFEAVSHQIEIKGLCVHCQIKHDVARPLSA